jgi:hypothetical protein
VGALINDDTINDQLNTTQTSIVSSTFPVFRLLGSDRFVSVVRYASREKYPMAMWEKAKGCEPVLNFPYKDFIRLTSTLETMKQTSPRLRKRCSA